MVGAILLVFGGLAPSVLSAAPAGASQVLDVTGSWSPAGTGCPWVLQAGGTSLQKLHAAWTGACDTKNVSGHSSLEGTFDGTLNSSGNAYTGTFAVHEGSVNVTGTGVFEIVSSTHIAVTLHATEGASNTSLITLTGHAGGWPALPDALVSIASVSNGCGGGVAGAYGIQQALGNTSTFLNSNNPFGTRYTVHFEMACNLHDAGYSGSKVLDPINGGIIDYFTYDQKQVDDKFLADMRKLCDEQIPAKAPVARADCKATGGKTSFGAETRYNFVRSLGHHFFRVRPELNGAWTGGGVTMEIAQGHRLISGSWRVGDVTGEFRGTLISRDQDSLVEGFANTSTEPAYSKISIVVNPEKANDLQFSSGVLSGTLKR